jgi:hypothetical protein
MPGPSPRSSPHFSQSTTADADPGKILRLRNVARATRGMPATRRPAVGSAGISRPPDSCAGSIFGGWRPGREAFCGGRRESIPGGSRRESRAPRPRKTLPTRSASGSGSGAHESGGSAASATGAGADTTGRDTPSSRRRRARGCTRSTSSTRTEPKASDRSGARFAYGVLTPRQASSRRMRPAAGERVNSFSARRRRGRLDRARWRACASSLPARRRA